MNNFGVNLIGDELPFTIAVDPDAVLPWSIGGIVFDLISKLKKKHF